MKGKDYDRPHLFNCRNPGEIHHLPELLDQEPGALIVTQHDKPVMAILPFNIYKELLETVESLQETLEILSDEELMASFRQGVKELAEGKGVPWEDVKKELGWE